VAGSNPGSSPGPNSEGRKISCEDIQLVQNLIERCLQLYMNQNEVITTLQYQAKIEPGFTSLVWQKLEEQNPEFFKAYYTRLKLKKQIMLFNHLLEQQVQLMHKMRLFPVQAPLLQNGMHLTPKTSTITMPVSCSIQLAWVWGMCDLFTGSPRLCVFSFIPLHFLLYL
jgi:uncharacterized protein (TIGR01589 family)